MNNPKPGDVWYEAVAPVPGAYLHASILPSGAMVKLYRVWAEAIDRWELDGVAIRCECIAEAEVSYQRDYWLPWLREGDMLQATWDHAPLWMRAVQFKPRHIWETNPL